MQKNIYRTMFEQSTQAMALIQDNRILLANAALAVMTENPINALTDMALGTFQDLFASADHLMINNALSTCQPGDPAPVRCQVNIKCQGGALLRVELAITGVVYNELSACLVIFNLPGGFQQAEQVQQVLYRISRFADVAKNMDDLYHAIHKILGELMPMENFFIALFDAATQNISFPYYVDKFDQPPQPRILAARGGLSDYVLRLGKPLLATPEVFAQLAEQGEVEAHGSDCVDWIGVPMHTENQTVGILVVQTYDERRRLGERERDILDFVSTQVGLVIKNKRAEAALQKQRDFLRQVIDITPNLIFAVDRQGRYTLVNQAMADFYATTVNYLTGKIGTDFNLNHDQVERFHREDLQVFDTQEEVVIPEEYVKDANGKTRIQYTSKRPIFETDGEVSQVLGVANDITQIKQRERELEAVATVSAALRKAQNHDEMIPIILTELANLLNADGTVVVEIDNVTDKIVIIQGQGIFSEYSGICITPGEGISHKVIREQNTYQFNDISQEKQFYLLEVVKTPHAAVCTPLRIRDHQLGAIWVVRKAGFDEAEIRLIHAIADIAASALNRATLHEQTEERLRRVNALHKVEIAISSRQDLKVTLKLLLDLVITELKVDAADILLLDPKTENFVFAEQSSFRSNFIEYTRVKIGEGLAGKAALTKSALVVNDLTKDEDDNRMILLSNEDFVSGFYAPLIVKEEVNGILEAYTRSPRHVESEWLDFFNVLAGQFAIAVDNFHLFNELQQSNSDMVKAYDATIEGWAKALELRDMETEGHSHRVTDLTVRLARQLNLSEEDIVHIRRGAFLHDIGKMGIPDGILLKPGPLSYDEWQVMRRHPEFAYNLLYGVEFLRLALDIPFSHHEKWDGSGYPMGMKKKEIPLSARIFAVVDVWDALTSTRPYRSSWSEEKTRDYLLEESGKYFDPEIVKEFLKMITS